ncbi:MAG: hypothetical protein HY903_11585 [Deltaproteobacteria bacterium]|nr:hypothetical protein [Deltaproteobacteria bacterium]
MLRSSLVAVAGVVVPLTVWPAAGAAFYNVKVGDPIANVTLPTIHGKDGTLLGKGVGASVFVLFRPDQENSKLGLAEMARAKQALAGKKVYWVGVVPGGFERATVETALAAAGLEMPVLLDNGDALYGKLGAMLHPTVAVVDGAGKLAAYEPFRKVDYGEVVKARVRLVLGEITAAELEATLNPPAAIQGGDGEVARRNLKLAELLYNGKQYAKAVDAALKAIDKAPDLARAHALAAAAYAAQDNCASARPHIDKALLLVPEEATALAAKKSCGAP